MSPGINVNKDHVSNSPWNAWLSLFPLCTVAWVNGPHSLWRTRVIIAVFIYSAGRVLPRCMVSLLFSRFPLERNDSWIREMARWSMALTIEPDNLSSIPLAPQGHGENWLLKVILHTCDTLLQFLSKNKYNDMWNLLRPTKILWHRQSDYSVPLNSSCCVNNIPYGNPTYCKDIFDILHFWLWREWVFTIGTAC